MKVLVYGSGGRDHCLADTYADSQHVDKVYFTPGNPGVKHTSKGKRGLIELVKLADFSQVADFCAEKGVDLVEVGSENPLEEGIALYFAGVDEDPDKGVVTYGGRVLHVVAGDATLEAAREKAYRNIRKIAFLDHNNENANCMRFRETVGL
ncbi:MAG: phosphoribosylglycinamide synthetase C domain-containing protein [Deltaproteobacteria bacterium]